MIKEDTDLLGAVFKCDLRKVKEFFRKGKNVNYVIPGTEGCTILHIFAGTKEVSSTEDMFSYLMSLGADPDARSWDELTPVHIAAMWNNCFKLEKLLQIGGNPWLIDNENKNAFDLAADNHAYEAYQLLNRYLAENKLNFKSENKLKESVNHKKSYNSLHCSNISFYSTNENFPLRFSSTEDENTSFLLDVSKILKKENLVPHKESNKISVCSNNLRKNLTNNSEFFSINNDTTSGDITETTINVNKRTFEGKLSAETFQSLSKGNLLDNITFQENDWKSHRSQSDCSLFSVKSDKSILSEYLNLSNSDIFRELTELGDKPGPVNDFTRNAYLRHLTKLKYGVQLPCLFNEQKFCPEIYQYLRNELNMSDILPLANAISEDFNNSLNKGDWREGRQKSCFNYFLLDPRVTQNLPTRSIGLKFEQTFRVFLDAIFYVGKGTKGRPYSHLLDAVKALSGLQSKNDKICHILDIWNSNCGVISLHCFHNLIPVEAYTQEACIIEAIGLKNLTNVRDGDYYGLAAKWSRSKKRKVGIFLLNRALQIFLIEGEKQIKPKDL